MAPLASNAGSIGMGSPSTEPFPPEKSQAHLISRVRARCEQLYYRARGHYPTKVAGRRFNVVPDRLKFWRSVAAGKWEPQTFEVLARYLNPESTYVDIGSWIGPTVIYAASLCKRVVCFEPDPVAYQELRRNISLNSLHNVQSFGVAVSDTLGIRRMASFGRGLGDSTTSLIHPLAATAGIDVLSVPWSIFEGSADYSRPDLIKVDIEGGEFGLIPSMSAYFGKQRPVLYLSTHAPFMPEARRIDAMRKIRESLSNYSTILGENLEPVDAAEMTNERSLNEFRSFVFI